MSVCPISKNIYWHYDLDVACKKVIQFNPCLQKTGGSKINRKNEKNEGQDENEGKKLPHVREQLKPNN